MVRISFVELKRENCVAPADDSIPYTVYITIMIWQLLTIQRLPGMDKRKKSILCSPKIRCNALDATWSRKDFSRESDVLRFGPIGEPHTMSAHSPNVVHVVSYLFRNSSMLGWRWRNWTMPEVQLTDQKFPSLLGI